MAMIALAVATVLTLRLAQPDLRFDLAGVQMVDFGQTQVEYRGQDARLRALVPLADKDAAPTLPAAWEAFATSHPAIIPLENSDLIEDPDMLSHYAAINAFFRKQQLIYAALPKTEWSLAIESQGTLHLVPLQVDRSSTIGRLSFEFWVQLAAGTVVLTVAALLLALRPGMARQSRGRLGLAHFALSGLGVAGSAFCAAIYASRSLTMQPDLFRILTTLNHIATFLFGLGTIWLFASYPTRLLAQKWLTPLLAVLVLGMLGYQFQVLPFDWVRPQNWIAAMFVIILALVILQLRATRGNPADRAALMWLGLSVTLGAGVFVTLVALPAALGAPMVISQGLAFLPLCAIYIGTALALARYRLFDLERWAWRVFFHGATVAVLVAVDLALISVLKLSAPASIASAVLVVGLVYFPLRDLVFDRLLSKKPLQLPAIYRQTVAVALQLDAQSKAAAWHQALETVFHPLNIEACTAPLGSPVIRAEGLALVVPAQAWSGALRLGFADQGRRLFNTADVALLGELISLVQASESDRQTMDRALTSERQRIARDLHDDVGARLLSALHAKEPPRAQEFLVEALADLRQIASGLAGNAMTLEGLIAEMRHEGRMRAQAHGFDLDWPLGSADEDGRELPYVVHRNLFAIHREALSNALDHGSAGRILVQAELSDGWLTYRMENPMVPHPDVAALPARGKGRANMQTRATLLQGELTCAAQDGVFILTLRIPLPSMTIN